MMPPPPVKSFKPDLKAWMIVGSERDLEPGVKQELQMIAAKYDVSERVIFAGSRDDVRMLLYSFDLFVMPSRVEGFGLALVEAMVSGVPAIVSDIAAFEELTERGTYALLFESGNSRDLCEKLRFALNHADEMAEMAPRDLLVKMALKVLLDPQAPQDKMVKVQVAADAKN